MAGWGGGAALANVEQARAWDGQSGAHWVRFERHYREATIHYTRRLLEAARIAPGERVLDVGCGSGETTRAAARQATPATATGLDLSAALVALARQRSSEEQVANVVFVQADAEVHPLQPATFDVVISHFGSMFFGRPEVAFSNLARALRPGGRLALMSWRELDDNPWVAAVMGALALGRTLPTPPADRPGGFALADPQRVRRLLEGAGFGEVGLEPVDAPMSFGRDVDDAFAFFSSSDLAKGLLEDLAAGERARALEALRAELTGAATPSGVVMRSGAWLITARRLRVAGSDREGELQ